jgi:hypothetical protein
MSLDETTYGFNIIDYKWQKFSVMHMTNNNKMDLTNLQNSSPIESWLTHKKNISN